MRICSLNRAARYSIVPFDLGVVSTSRQVPLVLTVSNEHRPVVESQLEVKQSFEVTHPIVKQSPTRTSSRAKPPVWLEPDVYLVVGRGGIT